MSNPLYNPLKTILDGAIKIKACYLSVELLFLLSVAQADHSERVVL